MMQPEQESFTSRIELQSSVYLIVLFARGILMIIHLHGLHMIGEHYIKPPSLEIAAEKVCSLSLKHHLLLSLLILYILVQEV